MEIIISNYNNNKDIITKGDYARFNDRTYLDVYEEIKSQAREEYLIEVEKHNQTKKDFSERKEK